MERRSKRTKQRRKNYKRNKERKNENEREGCKRRKGTDKSNQSDASIFKTYNPPPIIEPVTVQRQIACRSNFKKGSFIPCTVGTREQRKEE